MVYVTYAQPNSMWPVGALRIQKIFTCLTSKICNFQCRLYDLEETLLKSTCLTGSFTCPWQLGSGICQPARCFSCFFFLFFFCVCNAEEWHTLNPCFMNAFGTIGLWLCTGVLFSTLYTCDLFMILQCTCISNLQQDRGQGWGLLNKFPPFH